MNYVYIKYEDDLLRILEPSTTVHKLAGDKKFVDPNKKLVRAFRPKGGLGWESAEENGPFIVERIGVMIQLQNVPNAGWIKSAEYSDGTNKYPEEVIKDYFKTPTRVKTVLGGELNKYKDLQMYFGDLTVEDVESFSEEQLLEGVLGKHKILMRSFFQNEFSKLKKYYTIIPPEGPQLDLSVLQKRIVLDLRQKVVSTQKVAPPYKIAISKVMETVKAANLHAKFLLDINLSKCFLSDEDLPYITQLLDHFERCLRIDLSNNHFGRRGCEADQIVLQMLDPLKYPNLEFVNLSLNPIIYIERQDFIEGLNEDALKRLIWMPAAYLNHQKCAWRQLIKEEWHEVVEHAHKTYYDL